MNIITDLHTHSIAVGHAYSTIIENAAEAAKKGIEAIGVTEHTLSAPDHPHIFYFANLKMLPKYIHGVRMLKGVELDILNEKGEVFLPEDILKKLEIVVASIHGVSHVHKGGDDYDATDAYMNALENPYIDILGHTGSPLFKYDIDKVVKRAGELGKMIEINANSFTYRKRNVPRCREIALACKKYGTSIAVNSDAHICFNIGEFKKPIDMLKEIDFPYELIANRNLKSLGEFLSPRKNIM